MTPTDELRSCPYCGSKPELLMTLDVLSYRVDCRVCAPHDWKHKKEWAIDNWNRRASDTKPEHVTQNETQNLCNIDSQKPEASVDVKPRELNEKDKT